MNKKLLLVSMLLSANFLFAGNPTTHGTFGYTQNKGQVIDQNNNLNPAVKYLWKQPFGNS